MAALSQAPKRFTLSLSCVRGGMIAVRIGPDMRMAVVGAPSYFARRKRPQTPQDLTAHDCINLRLPTYDGLYAWEFEKDGRELKVRAEGQFVFNNVALRLNAALADCTQNRV